MDQSIIKIIKVSAAVQTPSSGSPSYSSSSSSSSFTGAELSAWHFGGVAVFLQQTLAKPVNRGIFAGFQQDGSSGPAQGFYLLKWGGGGGGGWLGVFSFVKPLEKTFF